MFQATLEVFCLPVLDRAVGAPAAAKFEGILTTGCKTAARKRHAVSTIPVIRFEDVFD